jgi:membrane protease subunit HflC
MSPLPINHPLLRFTRRLSDLLISPLGAAIVILAGIVLFGSAYTVDQTEQVVITQFGRPVGEAINSNKNSDGAGPGLHFKIPFVQAANRFDKRILAWDGNPVEMTTRDKLYVIVDTFARWRIVDPLVYLESLRDERSALSRIDDIIGSETRNVVARHDLIELIRSSKDRTAERDETLGDVEGLVGTLPPIQFGRRQLERQILEAAAPKMGIWGIELLDVRIKRLNYKAGVIGKIYDRMMSERIQIAERFRSEGAGEAAKIEGRKRRDLERIQSEAYRKVQEIRGDADAQASEVYAAAYGESPAAADFYAFQKTLETYRATLGAGTTVVLTTNSDLFKLLKRISPEPAAPAEAVGE